MSGDWRTRCYHCGRLKALDSFGGSGGMGKGLMRAGFCVDAVDMSQARLDEYPRECPAALVIKADAIELILSRGHEYAAIHASPTCTGYSQGTVAIPDRVSRYDRLIPAVREALEIAGRPYIIENVYGARNELRNPVMLCGRMFGLTAIDDDGTVLTLDRHRMFEVSGFPLMAPEHVPHDWRYNRSHGIQVAGAYGGARRDKHEAKYIRKGGYVPSARVMGELLGIDWMTEPGLKLSIPPIYGQFIGEQLLAHLGDTWPQGHANDCACPRCYEAATGRSA